jgi:hypothetical protein
MSNNEENKVKSVGSGKYSVYQLTNNDQDSTNRGKRLFVVSTLTSPEGVRSMVRAMAKTDTAGGGNKELSTDMKSSGKHYSEKYSVSKLITGASKDQAEALKGKLISKYGVKKVYNKTLPLE